MAWPEGSLNMHVSKADADHRCFLVFMFIRFNPVPKRDCFQRTFYNKGMANYFGPIPFYAAYGNAAKKTTK